MKTLGLTILILIATFTPSALAQSSAYPDPSGNLTVEYDRFKDTTTVLLDAMLVHDEANDKLYITLRGDYTGTQKVKPTSVGIGFSSWALVGYNYTEPVELDVIINGKGIPVGTVQPIKTTEVNGKNVTIMAIIIPFEVYEKIAWSRTAEFRLGRTEFSLKPEHYSTLRAFSFRLTP